MNKCVMLLFLLVAGVISCKKTKKEEAGISDKPKITIVSTSVPQVTEFLCDASFDNVLKIPVGTRFDITLHFEGSTNLSQYKLDAHNNFDCHSHGKSNPWSMLKIVDITGTDFTVTETIQIPEAAAVGNYHFMIKLLDEIGNEAQDVEFNVILVNNEDPVAPVISMTQPAVDSISIVKGNTLVFEGEITDNLSLADGKYQISYIDSEGEVFNIMEHFFPSGVTTSHVFSDSYVIPTYSHTGVAVFYIRAFDNVNNSSTKQIKVNILD